MKNLKRILSLILSIVFVFSCSTVAVSATEASELDISISSVYDVMPGQKCSIDITLSGLEQLPNRKGDILFEVLFPSIVTINSVYLGDTALSKNNNDYNILEDYRLRIYNELNYSADEAWDGILKWTVYFTVSDLADLGSYHIGFNGTPEIIDSLGEEYAVNIKDGCVVLTADEASLYGDTDGDGAVAAADISLMRKYLIGLNQLDLLVENSDTHFDGKIDIKDLVGLKKYIASQEIKYEETKLDNAENLSDIKYFGNGYAYAITKENEEIIAFSDENGYVDTLNGAGNFVLYSGKNNLLSYNGIKDTQLVENEDGTSTLTVTYDVTGENVTSASATTEYLFHNGGISVKSDISCESADTIDSAEYKRSFINSPVKTEKKLSYNWVFPDGNYPYQETDAIATVSSIDSTHKLYSFNRDENDREYVYIKTYPNENFPVNITSGNQVNYTIKYDLVFENTNKTNDSDSSALFKSKQSDISVKIAPVTSNDDNSTVFIGDSVALNIAVNNISVSDTAYNLSYKVYDYYGEKLSSADENVTLAIGENKDYEINISGKKGMYFIDLTATCGDYTYREYYPLMLTDEYSYNSNDIRFGIDALHRNTIIEENTSVSLAKKLGIDIIRIGASDSDLRLAKKLYSNGIKTFAGYGGTFETAEKAQMFAETWKKMKDFTEWFTLANEVDIAVKGNQSACDALMNDTFIPNYFNADMRTAVEEHKINISWCASCVGNEEWAQAMYDSGVWQNSDIIDTHLYANPKLPDKKFRSDANDAYCIEAGLQRMNNSFVKFGRDDKKFVLGETGYPIGTIDLRTQADFNTRIGVLALAYGVDIISYYSMYDRTSYFTGADKNDQEMNFGAFYAYDFYGITKPKPWAAAYSAMTRMFDGAIGAEINTKYDKLTEENMNSKDEGTVRSFDITLSGGKTLMAAWTNIYALPKTVSSEVNDDSIEPKKVLPWENQWEKTEDVVFDVKEGVSSVTVYDVMGNSTEYSVSGSTVTIPLTGSPVYIEGVY